jgi:cell division protein FtsZ
MTYQNSQMPRPDDIFDIRPRITVVGVGGAGGNAVNNMVRSQLEGVEFIVANTDAQALTQSLVPSERWIQLGLNITQGLGAGSKPEVGRAAAEESLDEIIKYIDGSNMLFITAGMGGGTGTGAAPVIARVAREKGILTVGVVTKPFHFEGSRRLKSAESGIEELQQYVDTLIVIPNQNLFRVANEKTTFADSFRMADDVLYSGVRSVTDLMIMPGLINLDFADIRAIMAGMGKAMMGTGEAEGEGRALAAAESAISSQLLDDVSLKGAEGVLISITGGADLKLHEVDEAANRIREDVESSANIIFGATFDERLNGRLRVSVVATGIGRSHPGTPALSSSILQSRSDTSRAYSIGDSGSSSTKKIDPLSQSFFENQSPLDPVESLEVETTIDESLEDSNALKSPKVTFHSSQPQLSEKRKISLFERFTGVSRSKSSLFNAQPVDGPEGLNQSLNDAKSPEDDFLDIPAFMRRKK